MLRYAGDRYVLRLLLLVGWVGLIGCEPRRTRNRYSVIAGKVVACHPDTGELSVRGALRTPEGPAEKTLYCVVTDHSEVYINDKFSSIEEIQLGDAVELIGYRDPDPQFERFVVSFAYVDHPVPLPSPPNLVPASVPSTQNSTDPQTRQEE